MSKIKKVMSKSMNNFRTSTYNDIKPNTRIIETYQYSQKNYHLLQNSVSKNPIYIANETK